MLVKLVYGEHLINCGDANVVHCAMKRWLPCQYHDKHEIVGDMLSERYGAKLFTLHKPFRKYSTDTLNAHPIMRPSRTNPP